MKNVWSFFSLIILVFLLFTSCNEQSSETTDSTKTSLSNGISESHPDTVQSKKPETLELKVKIFFSTYDGIDEEGNEYKSVTEERTQFTNERTYTFCYDSEDFDHLLIEGNAQNISFYVKNSESTVFSKENFKLEKQITFTGKDFGFNIGIPYQIIIKQNNETVFEGTIHSEGCM